MTNIGAASNSSSETTTGEAILDNNGNFVLRSAQGIILWQSFDYPTDTLLPGMSLSITHKTHALQRLISWMDPQDPFPGNFSYGADPDDFLQRFTWNGSRPYRRSPVWSNYFTGGLAYAGSLTTIYMILHRIGDEIYMSFMPGGSSEVQFKMDYSGKVKILVWNSSRSEWITVTKQPNQECNIYGYCGPFGYCDNSEPIATCKCLEGFEPNNNKDWTNGKFSQGCHQKETLTCGQENDYLTLTTMKIPDMFLHVKDKSFDECKAECSSNCSCKAYAYSIMSAKTINYDETRCLLWMGDLIDTEKLIDEGENLYIRIGRFQGNMRKRNIVKAVLSVVASLLIIIFMWLVWINKCRGKWQNKKNWKKLMLGILGDSDELGEEKLKYPFISFREITIATNNFSDSNMLGRGGFGNVYKGSLEDGKEIAVKRLNKGSNQGDVEFRNEVVLIARLQHRNLVRLLGCCIHEDEKLLIYEYLPNKSLDTFLFNDTRKSVLDWPTRFKIIKGVARGLLYLHQDSRLTIIHRDLKASNILLDAEMNPKISDFGMARIFGGNQHQANTNRVVGTYGYMSPEYALEGAFSVKSDVYSFGVLLLEIVSGSRISSKHFASDALNLIAFAWNLWNDGNPKDLVDSSIVESCLLDEVLRCIHTGLLCVQDNPNARLLMSSVASILENGAIALPPPKQPIYFAQRNDESGKYIENSENKMSFTALEGR